MSKSIVKWNQQARVARSANKRVGMNQLAVINRTGKPTVKSVNRKVKKIQNRQELKWVDHLISGIEMVSVPASTQIRLVNPLSQGNSSITRLGDRVAYTSIQMRGVILLDPDNLAGCTWRFLIVRDMQANGAAPTLATILDSSVITSLVYAPYNRDNSDRFRIISDKSGVLYPVRNQTVTTGATDTTATVGQTSHKVKIKRQLNFQTNYGLGNAGTVADISKNSVYIILISDQVDANDTGPSMTGGIRMYYKDD